MKTRTLYMIPVVGLLVLAGVFFNAHPPSAHTDDPCALPDGVTLPPDPPVTAQQVEDGSGSLMDFALAARDQFKTPVILPYLLCDIRQEGRPYRSGSTYLVQLTMDGRVFVHAKSMSLSGRLLNPVIYAEILSALGVSPTTLADLASPDPAVAGRAFGALYAALVQDRDAPFDATSLVPGASGYATTFLDLTGTPLVMLAGFDLDESHLSEEEIDYGNPAVTARDVVDRSTLKAFVAEAGKYFGERLRAGGSAATQAKIALRDPNGPWRHGSVYLYILLSTNNIVMFHGAFPDIFELQPLVGIARDGVTGELILPQVLEAAKSSPEGGFVEYFYDDPNDDTDSADIPKVGYAREFIGEYGLPDGSGSQVTYIVGSGFYGRAPDPPPHSEACPLPPGVTPPPDPSVTAQQVEDGSGNLKDFALAARDQFKSESITSLEQALYFGCLIRQEGSPYRSGSTYLVQLTPDGRVFVHTKDMALSGRQLHLPIYFAILQALGIDPADLVNPAAALAALNAAVARDGGAFNVPGVPGASGYATIYLSPTTQTPFVLLAGFDLDSSHLAPESIDYGDPAITASEVVDRETLKAFVTEAGEYVLALQTSGDLSAISKIRIALRDENGPWKHGSVYLYVLDLTSNIVLLHAAFPDRFELRPLVGIARDGVTGELILPQVLEAAQSSPEGGFVEYFYDDPADDTDSADIPKVGYARVFSGELQRPDGSTVQADFVVGSGFYGRAPDDVPDGTLTQVEATVLGDTVDGLTIAFCSIHRRPNNPTTPGVPSQMANGALSLTISSADGVSGYYQAAPPQRRWRDRRTVAQHSSSITINARSWN